MAIRSVRVTNRCSALTADDDVLSDRGRRRDRDAVFLQAFDVELDGFVHILFRLFASGTGRHTTWEVRRVRREVLSSVLHDDEKTFSSILLASGYFRMFSEPSRHSVCPRW